MAARNRIGLSEQTRLRIKTTMIVESLQKHISGDTEMAPSQVRAAEILLNKTLPNLSSVEMKAEVEEVQRVISAEPVSEAEWEAKHGK